MLSGYLEPSRSQSGVDQAFDGYLDRVDAIDRRALQASLRRLGRLCDKPLSVNELLTQVVSAARELFPVTGTGLMVIDEGQVLRYVASTDKAGRLLEAAQEKAGVGPCVEALVLNRTVATRDIQADCRWPDVSAALDGSLVRAVLGVPVHLGGGPVGSLDAYVDTEHDWTTAEEAALRAYAGVIEHLLTFRLWMDRSEELTQQLQYALDYRVVIERGVGYLMARDGVDPIEAFNRLRSAARNSRRKVVDVAADLLAGQPLP